MMKLGRSCRYAYVVLGSAKKGKKKRKTVLDYRAAVFFE